MAESMDGAANTNYSSGSYLHKLNRNTLHAVPYKLDEGYSEDTRSQDDVAGAEGDAEPSMDERNGYRSSDLPLPDWILNMNEADRGDFVYTVLRTLPTYEISAIVQRMYPLLHLDPVKHLPPEITLEIFSYLEPETLLKTSILSRSWRSSTLDSQLWRLLYKSEGWTANIYRVRAFEETQRQAWLTNRKSRARRAEGSGERPSQKKRPREQSSTGTEDATGQSSGEPAHPDGNPEGWAEQHGVVEADVTPTNGQDDAMQGVAYASAPPVFSSPQMTKAVGLFMRRASIMDVAPPAPKAGSGGGSLHSSLLPLDPPITPQVVLSSSYSYPKMNWHYIYKQKRRLEDNWNKMRFTTFQIPHPSFAQESHTECVYTIQYSGNYLVSGSRDKTLRIWDLTTQRLARPPLRGHTASVLCLQFDERPSQDIIASGGSDCHVIVWKFSTGQVIQKLEKAHSESVLNLRFDHRYLITCSKDKTIKVWNRQDLVPTDDAYPKNTTSGPKFPSYIVDLQHVADIQGLNVAPVPKHSLLMTLDGHSAAVNAIQIYENQIVSASGDRTVKIWDVQTGRCLQTIGGHNKGIACVQFDGRRIVSGSSDETVRIFDRITGAEVACLQGHTNLVRTVQADFGDSPGNEQDLEAEALAVDMRFFEARDRGLLSEDIPRERRKARNAGSRDPNHIFAYGAKLPPGGGGSRWARIVSGSYDESVIVWRRDADGCWVKSSTLMQHDAIRASGGRPRRVPQNALPTHPHANGQAAQGGHQVGGTAAAAAGTSHLANMTQNIQSIAAQAQAQAQQAQSLVAQAQALQAQSQAAQQARQAAQQAQRAQGGGVAADGQQQQQNAVAGPSGSSPSSAQQQNAVAGPSGSSPSSAQQQPATGSGAGTSSQPQPAVPTAQPSAAASPPATTATQSTFPYHHQPQQPPPLQQPQPLQPPQQPLQQQQPAPTPPHPPHPLHHLPHDQHPPVTRTPPPAAAPTPPPPPPPPPAAGGGANSRVFKLQFDARRVICCSQDPVIVGWDFANGDEDIESASRFFGEAL